MLADPGSPCCSPRRRFGGAAEGTTPGVEPGPRAARVRRARGQPGRQAGGDNLAYVIYTSGSTGRPKGVPSRTRRSQPGALASAGLRAVPRERSGHADGRSGVRRLGLGAVALPHRRCQRARPDEGRASTRRRWSAGSRAADHAHIPAHAPGRGRAARGRWPADADLRVLLTGGDRLIRRPPAGLPFRLVNHYGPTENTVVSTCARGGGAGTTPPPIGRPIANTRAYVAGRRPRTVPVGVPGELLHRRSRVAAGYWAAPTSPPRGSCPTRSRHARGPPLSHRRSGAPSRRRQAGVPGPPRPAGQDPRASASSWARSRPCWRRIRPCARWSWSPARTRRATRAWWRTWSPRVPARLGGSCGPDALEARCPNTWCPPLSSLDALPLTPNGKVDRRALPSPRDLVNAPATARGTAQCDASSGLPPIWQRRARPEAGRASPTISSTWAGTRCCWSRCTPASRRDADSRPEVVDLFQHPTIAALAATPARGRGPTSADAALGASRAGATPRYAGARSPSSAWPGASRAPRASRSSGRNLRDGESSRSVLHRRGAPATAATAEAAAARSELRQGRRRARRAPSSFDAGFFGYTPREAEVIDPQQRVFLEMRLGGPGARRLRPGALSGRRSGSTPASGMNTYLRQPATPNAERGRRRWAACRRARQRQGLPDDARLLQAQPAGPERQRADRLLDVAGRGAPGLPEPAAAASATWRSPAASRSRAAETRLPVPRDGILSPDGHCRAFDARRRARCAATASAWWCSSGSRTRSPTATHPRGHQGLRDQQRRLGTRSATPRPSVEGQAEVIALAQAVAGVAPDTIGYVEAHGTGTALGDPIEVAALTQAFRAARRPGAGFCAIGSVKTNIGHLDAAAGVAGLIKAVAGARAPRAPAEPALRDGRTRQIDFAGSPFYVNDRAAAAGRRRAAPRRAGVSSFGIGGTNAHVVLEEAPPRAPAADRRGRGSCWRSRRKERRHSSRSRRRPARSSARASRPALATSPTRCRAAGEPSRIGAPSSAPSRAMPARCWRRRPGGASVDAAADGAVAAEVAFLFPGQGSQHLGMGRGSTRTSVFREEVDRCCGT